MAETPSVMPQLHMPLQSGSDRILKAMRRSYRSERFLGILDRVRDRIPDAAISTDIIVGFPGETEEDFADTLRVVEQARFASAFTFPYSIRPGTPAATLPDQVPKAVVQERYERLTALQDRISGEENERLVGTGVEVLVSSGEGRRDAATARMSGRSEDNRLVNFDVPEVSTVPRPGDVASVVITRATPHYLIAAPTEGHLTVRRTRAGDAWDRAEAESCALPVHSTASAPGAVNIGLPTIRAGA
jgi:tRNA-2-methylthio-N6-dimethylallyladenosine synthase